MENIELKELLASTKEYEFNNANIKNVINKLEGISECECELKVGYIKRLLNIVRAEKNDLERQVQGNSINAKTWTVVGLIITVFLAFYSEILSSLFKEGINVTVYTILLVLTMLLIIVLGFLGVRDAFRSAKKYELLKNVELLQYNLEVLIEEANYNTKNNNDQLTSSI